MAALKVIALVCFVTSVLGNPGNSGEVNPCEEDPLGLAYRGNLSKTWGNHTCRSWTDGLAVAYNFTADKHPNAGLGDHNYCRTVDSHVMVAPYCLTVDIDAFWQYCELGIFHPDCRKTSNDRRECYTSDRADDYRGRVNVTLTGKTCQKWSAQSPQPHPYTQEAYPNAGLGDHNYCRNPAPSRFYAWCYTTLNQVEWEYCNIGLPSPTCSGACGAKGGYK